MQGVKKKVSAFPSSLPCPGRLALGVDFGNTEHFRKQAILQICYLKETQTDTKLIFLNEIIQQEPVLPTVLGESNEGKMPATQWADLVK